MPLLIVFSISLTSLVLHLANFIKTKQNKTKMLVGQVCSCSPEFQKISSSSEFQAIRPHCLPRFLGTVIPYSLRLPVINPIFSFSSCPCCHCWWRQCLCCVSVISILAFYPSSVQFSSVAQLCPTLCDPMNRRTPGLPGPHQLPESTQSHVHLVGDAIQSSHPLSSPSPPACNLSQHRGLFK